MKNKINLPFGNPWITNKEISAVNKVLKGKILVHGQHTVNFEKQFKKFTKSKYAIAVSSCTAGMHLFYYSVGIGKGDEVIVPAQTHLATAHAVELNGAKAVFVDSTLDTGNIDIEKIESKITKKTKAICVVHYLGLPVDIKKIKYLAKKYNLYIVEDCALALGAKYYNNHVGTMGDVGVFSFYPVKHITTAEGGMMILNNKKLATKIRLLRAFGVNKNFNQRKLPGIYDCEYLGFNYRMSKIHAAIGIEQLTKLPTILQKRTILYGCAARLRILKLMEPLPISLTVRNVVKTEYISPTKGAPDPVGTPLTCMHTLSLPPLGSGFKLACPPRHTRGHLMGAKLFN